MLRDALQLVREKVVEVLRPPARLRVGIQGPADAGLHPSAAGAADHRGQARLPVDAGSDSWIWRRSTLRCPRCACWATSGATGTQVSFMELFDGDGAKVDELEARIARKMGMEKRVRGLRPDLSPQAGQPRARTRSRAWRRAPTSSRRICACFSPSGRSRSPLRRTRSARRPWPTSAIPCAPSASAHCPAT